MSKEYLFTSARLGFRNWSLSDLSLLAAINTDPDVMEHFPNMLTLEESEAMIHRFNNNYAHHGYTYYAVDVLETGKCIGFIGMSYQDYASECTPATDIGWRLSKSAWGRGYATEGAKRCLEYAFNELSLTSIIATCTLQNLKSENVMKKIGMAYKGIFDHPKLVDYPDFIKCKWYEIRNAI